MMSKQPQKRLVSKGRYVWVMTGRTTLTSGTLIAAGAGALASILAATCLYVALDPAVPAMRNSGIALSCALVCGAGGAFFLAYCLNRAKKKIDVVVPITKQTTHLLPPEESLVRASDAPADGLEDELLRAAQFGTQTPAEELLRAVQTNTQA